MKLKTCRICGRPSGELWKMHDLKNNIIQYQISCRICDANTDAYNTAKKAVKEWNK